MASRLGLRHDINRLCWLHDTAKNRRPDVKDYKPLTDEELTRIRRGCTYSEDDFHRLIEQARRANALVQALAEDHPYNDDLGAYVLAALARYHGDTP